jgi:hypothetical protein
MRAADGRGLGRTVAPPPGETGAKAALVSVALTLLVIALFDLAGYLLLPAELAVRLHPYRCPACGLLPAVPGRGVDLHDYYAADAERGFDIAPNRTAKLHHVDGTTYPVWSNRLGCFDTEPGPGGEYVYLAGDSFVWGFTPYDDKLGTVLERRLGVPVAKCGVIGTGQLHQLGKMRGVIDAVGRRPRLIVDVYFENDVADDLVHPRYTVVDGWLEEAVGLVEQDGRFAVRPRPPAAIRAAVAAEGVVPEAGLLAALSYGAAKYSLSYDVARGLLAQARDVVASAVGRGPGPPRGVYRPELWQRNGRFWYADNLYAARNRSALREMKAYADGLGVPLFLLLIPPKQHAAEPAYYDELKAALRAMGIGFADATEHFAENGYRWWELYWPRDAHLGPDGNGVVGNFLAERVGPLLGETGDATRAEPARGDPGAGGGEPRGPGGR